MTCTWKWKTVCHAAGSHEFRRFTPSQSSRSPIASASRLAASTVLSRSSSSISYRLRECRRGITSAWPRVHGLMSMNEMVCSSSATFSAGSSPAAILQKMQSSSAKAGTLKGLQPAGPAQTPVKHRAQKHHHEEHRRVPEAPRQLRYVLEVHAVDRGDRRGHGGDRDPGRDLAHVLVLAHADLGEVGAEDAGEQVAVALDLLVDPDQMVHHVAEVLLDVRMDDLEVTARQPLAGIDQRRHAVAELEHLALELVDALRGVAPGRGEPLGLHLLDVLRQAVHRGLVVVHDPVEDRVEH